MHQAGAQTKPQKPMINGGDGASLLAQSQLTLQSQPHLTGAQSTNQQQQSSQGQQQPSSSAGSNQGGQLNATTASGTGTAAASTTAPSSTIGQGTTNQQRLKSHVQQFVNKIRKESDKFYKIFAEVCKNNRDSEKSMEFHSELGKLFSPYGDILMEINKMLHIDKQYTIPESSQHTTLKDSEISNDHIAFLNSRTNYNPGSANAVRGDEDSQYSSVAGSNRDIPGKENGKKTSAESDVTNGKPTINSTVSSNIRPNHQDIKPLSNVNQKEIVTQKLQEFCLIIKQECPDKMNSFVTALKHKLNGQEDQLRLFIQTCYEIFGEGHSIYQKAQSLFKEIPQNNNLQAGNIDNTQTGQAQEQQLPVKKKTRKNIPKDAPQLITPNDKKTDTAPVVTQPKESGNGTSQVPATNPLTTIIDDKKNQIINKDGLRPPTPNQGQGKLVSQGTPSVNKEFPPPMNGSEFPLPKGIHGGITKSEQQFMYLIDNHMDSIAFMNMLKLLYLYVECIITASEMIEQGSYLLQGFNNPEKLIEQLKDLVECRENSRRKATPYFKPLNDFDFNHHERFTHSYVEMPKFYPKYCSNSTELTKSVLNTSIVTVPQGTEHVTFSIMRKNQYEEQLFKSEDEKYEYDHHIQMYRRTIKLLEQVETCEDFEQSRRLMQQAIDLKMIVCLYKNGSPEQQEICEILLSNPKKTVVVALERVRSKLREIEEAKMNQARKQWHEVAEKNFHRSLDHRSFIFKRHDRKFTLSTRFEKEPEFRNRMLMRVSSYLTHQQQQQQLHLQQQQQQQQLLQLQQGSTRSAGAAMAIKAQHQNEDGIENNQDFETDVSNYFQFLNTFQGTTNIEKCSHSSHDSQLIKFDYQNTPRKFSLPMMTFIFEDPEICEDTFSLLMHYQLYAALNQSEREKIKRTAQMVLKGFFDLSFKNIEQTDITLNENKTIKIVTEIENKIFEKIYAYLRPINREGGDTPQVNDKSGKGQDGETMAEETEDQGDGKENKTKSDDKNEDEEGEEKENQNGEEKDKKKSEGAECSSKPAKGKNTKSPSSNHLNSASKKQQPKDTNNDGEMEIETEGNEQRKGKSQESGADQGSQAGENNQDKVNNSSLNDILDDENSKTGEKIREMAYKMDSIDEIIYLPKFDQDKMQVFYGTKNLYIFLRFFYVLYERLYKAQEISRYFEDNEKTQKLTDQEKEELAKERYSTFKNILIGSLKQRETKYEDYLRSIFGKSAFLLFTIDKTLQSATKSLQALASDELSQKILQLYIHPEEFRQKTSIPSREETLYVKINKIILDSTLKGNVSSGDTRSFFRFCRNKNDNILYINYIDSYYKNWEIDQINKSREYFNHYMTEPTPVNQVKTNNSEISVYLSRNKRKNAEKVQQKEIQVFQQNNIEYHTYSNTNHIINSSNNKEDFLVTSSKLKRRAVPLDQIVAVEYNKKVKFEQWYNKQTESIIQFKTKPEPKKVIKNTAANSSTNNTTEEAESKSAVQHSTNNHTEKSTSSDTIKTNDTPNPQGSSAASSEMKSE